MPDFLAEVLTWPSNYGIALAVQTAMDLNLPPTVMILADRQPTDGWSPQDKKLAIAWTVLQRETCTKCGQPMWVCRGSNKNIGFSVRKGMCYQSAELEKRSDREGAKLKKGEYFYATPKTYDDTPLPGALRKAYMEELAEE